MRHRRGCEDSPALYRVTSVGPRQWFVYKCPTCAATELRPSMKEQ